MKITTDRLDEDEVWQTYFNSQLIRGYSPNLTLRAYIIERGLFDPVSHRTLRRHNWQGREKNWSSSIQGKTWIQVKWPCTLWNGRYFMQELYNGSHRRDVVQGARGSWYVLHKRHSPQTPRPYHQVLFGTTHRRCGGYSSIDEKPLQRRRRDPTIHQRYGSSVAKIQVGKTRHSWRVYARCGAKTAAPIRWVQNGNMGIVETPGRP